MGELEITHNPRDTSAFIPATPDLPGSRWLAVAREWLWRGQAMARARAGFDATLSAAQRTELLRVRAIASAARAMAQPPPTAEPADDDNARPATARALYREAIEAALRVMADAAGVQRPTSIVEALDAVPGRWLAGVGPLGIDLASADLPAVETFAHALLDAMVPTPRRVARARRERASRVAAAVALVAFARPAVEFTFEALLYPDMAASASWRASSAESGYETSGRGFTVKLSAPYVFMHTLNEPDPWVAFDLGVSRALHEVMVINRGECCDERAIPLVLEVGDDGRTWREIAHRTEAFTVWHVRRASLRGRYVRLRAARTTMLHLERVEIR